MDRLCITRPDDWHVHLRDGTAMRSAVADTARRFGRAVVMPNLNPPIASTAQALDYRARILEAIPHGHRFAPLMTLYLTDNTRPEEIRRAKASGIVHAVKYYPAGATTHSEWGVTDIRKCFAALEEMAVQGLPLLIHGEVTDASVDVFDRERVFIERELPKLVERLPALRIVLEHITTAHAVEFVQAAPANIAATITAHHLLLNRNALFQGGLRPHHYCLPVLKREEHRRALVRAAVSGNRKFFLGTDSAPHERAKKEAGCGCAGIYTAHAAIELYAEAFEAAGALDRLEGFASLHGPDFYGLPRNAETITLQKQPWTVPERLVFGESELVPLRAGQQVAWRLMDQSH
ncbi:MAG TPA: dihydroorotase [Burkholderiales bacterium]|jgi:dihydroorotase|nr:dihydroorotase [Burkholderiales bacterium]